MASRFCDKDPCPYLKKTIDMLISKKLSTDENLEIIVLPPDASLPPQIVFFSYCPFCGTRIDPEWISEIKSRGAES